MSQQISGSHQHKGSLTLSELPKTTFYLQEFELPGISFPSLRIGTLLTSINVQGETPEFSPFTARIFSDENFEVWQEMLKWGLGMTFPNEFKEHKDFLQERESKYSEGLLTAYNNKNLQIMQVRFKNITLINLDPIPFRHNTPSSEPHIVSASFDYTSLEIIKE